jgi:ethanolamine permease
MSASPPASPGDAKGHPELERTLGPITIWALGVGYVISGMYFGWNLGLPVGGPYGLLLATVVVTVMYVTFVLGYMELSCALPRAGGAFVYAREAFGPGVGFLAGVAQCVEFVFAPPAIALAIGTYASLYLPAVPPWVFAVIAYGLFTGLNAWGVKQSALFELGITILAVGELLIFAGVTLPRFEWAHFAQEPLPKGWAGAFAAVPFAIWFYLAIEGVANIAEEAKEPARDLPRGFLLAMATLVLLAATTLFGAVGVAGWKAVVYPPGSTTPSDSPLPLALASVFSPEHWLYHLVVSIGLCGLLASFHGIILVAGRATFELGRAGYFPAKLGVVHPGWKTPAWALLANMLVGLGALATGKTAEIIGVAVLGALTLYVVSMLSLFKLRASRPDLPRPFRTPLYPVVPGVALLLAVGSFVATAATGDWRVAAAYGGLLLLAALYYQSVAAKAPPPTGGPVAEWPAKP